MKALVGTRSDRSTLASMDNIALSLCIIWLRFQIMGVSDRGANMAQFKLIIRLRKTV